MSDKRNIFVVCVESLTNYNKKIVAAMQQYT